jgi:hypothetical protein
MAHSKEPKAVITTEDLQIDPVGVYQVMPNHEWLPSWWEWTHDLDLLESMYMEGYDPRKAREFAEAFLARPGSIYASLIRKVHLLRLDTIGLVVRNAGDMSRAVYTSTAMLRTSQAAT